MAYTLLSEINPNNRQWIICVRISRRWHYRRGTDTGPIDHTDLVLLDEQGNHMYGEISIDNVSQFEPLLQEGRVYELKKIIVAPVKSSFKPVRASFMIWFTRHTIVKEIKDVSSSFPMWTYDLTPFTQIPAPTSAPAYFVDVIGVITSISNVEHIQTASRPTSSLKRTIFIRDASNRQIRLDMWGECATRFDGETIQKIGQEESVVAIFVGTLPKMFKGQPSLSGSSACRWYINNNIPEINSLRASMQTKFIPLRVDTPSTQDISLSTKQTLTEEKTVRELLDLDLFDNEGVYFTCTVTIIRLAPAQRWWFSSCQLCHKTAIPDGTVYKCSDANCTSQDAEPKYRISLIGSDGTGETEFVLFGRIGQQITHKPILNLLRAERPMHEPLHALVAAARARNDIPNEIAAIVTQKYCFVVSVTEKSFLRRQPSFQVHRIATSLGKQLHSSLFHTSSTSSQTKYTKDKSLAYQETTIVWPEAQTSSQSYKDTQTPALLMHHPQHTSVLKIRDDHPQTTPVSTEKITASATTSSSPENIPLLHSVRRTLFTDSTPAKQAIATKISYPEHEMQESDPKSPIEPPKALLQKLEAKRSVSPPHHYTLDPPAKKAKASTSATE